MGSQGPASVLPGLRVRRPCDGCSQPTSSVALSTQYAKLEKGPSASSLQISLKGVTTSSRCFAGCLFSQAPSCYITCGGGSHPAPPASWVRPFAFQWGLRLFSGFRTLLFHNHFLRKRCALVKKTMCGNIISMSLEK